MQNLWAFTSSFSKDKRKMLKTKEADRRMNTLEGFYTNYLSYVRQNISRKKGDEYFRYLMFIFRRGRQTVPSLVQIYLRFHKGFCTITRNRWLIFSIDFYSKTTQRGTNIFCMKEKSLNYHQ